MTDPGGIRRAWLALMGLSALSTLLALLPVPAGWAALTGAGILALAWLKARIVLSRYMGLADAPVWQRGFDLSLGVFVLVLGSVYLLPLML